MESLSGRVLRGGLWMTALAVTGNCLGIARLLILARLLTPHDFGLVGAAVVALSLVESVSTTGILQALIRRQHAARDRFDTAFTLGLIRGGLASALLMIFAPAVGRFVESEDAVAIVRAMALVPLIRGLTNVGAIEFRKELTFGPHYLIHTSGVVAGLCVAVPLALWRADAWALVGGWLAQITVQVAMSYGVHPYRPRLSLNRRHVAELLGDGRWSSGSVAIAWVVTNGGQAVIGRLLGVPSLGLYHMAWRIAFLPTTEITNAFGAVTIGAYAKLQDAGPRVRSAYVRVFTAVALGAVPIAVGFAMYAADAVRLLLGSPWLSIVPVVRILAVAALCRAISVTAGPVFYGLNRSRLQTLAALVELGILAILLVPLALRAGPVGAAGASTAAAACGAAAALCLVSRLLGIRARALLPILASPLLACVPVVVLRGWVLGPLDTLIELAGAVLMSGVLYLAALVVLHRLDLCDLRLVVPSRMQPWLLRPIE